MRTIRLFWMGEQNYILNNNKGKRHITTRRNTMKSTRNINIRESGRTTEVCIHHRSPVLPRETKSQLETRILRKIVTNNDINFSAFSFSKANWEAINQCITENPFKPYCYSHVDLGVLALQVHA